MIMKKLSVDNFVKTSCGIDQYNSLKKNKSILGNSFKLIAGSTNLLGPNIKGPIFFSKTGYE